MKKALIFAFSFVISFMVIYMIYYYSRVKNLDRGLVVAASNLKHTNIGPLTGQPAGNTNYIYTPGIYQAMHRQPGHDSAWTLPLLGAIPDGNYVSARDAYSENMTDRLDAQILERFPRRNHPPLKFDNISLGDSMLFSYFFQELVLPASFTWSPEPLNYAGDIRALQYNPVEKDERVHFYLSADKKQMALLVNEGKTDLIFLSGGAKGLSEERLEAVDSMLAGRPYLLSQTEAVRVPNIDFFIAKKYDAKAIAALGAPYAGLQHMKLVEEHIKLKTSLKDINKDAREGAGAIYSFEGPSLLLLRQKGKSKPYFAMWLATPEILIHAR